MWKEEPVRNKQFTHYLLVELLLNKYQQEEPG